FLVKCPFNDSCNCSLSMGGYSCWVCFHDWFECSTCYQLSECSVSDGKNSCTCSKCFNNGIDNIGCWIVFRNFVRNRDVRLDSYGFSKNITRNGCSIFTSYDWFFRCAI